MPQVGDVDVLIENQLPLRIRKDVKRYLTFEYCSCEWLFEKSQTVHVSTGDRWAWTYPDPQEVHAVRD